MASDHLEMSSCDFFILNNYILFKTLVDRESSNLMLNSMRLLKEIFLPFKKAYDTQR